MAQNGQQADIQAVGAVGAAPKGQGAAPPQNVQQAPPQQQGGAVEGAAFQPADDLNLTPDAEHDLEEKKLEEQKKLQQQIDDLMQQIDDTKSQIQQAEEAHDPNRAATLKGQLGDLEAQLGALIDGPTVSNAARDLATPGGGPQLIPAPPGGAFGGAGGAGFNPYAFGNMGLSMAGGRGGLSPANFAPPADPSVNIPDYGKGANKAQIGEMLDAASKKYGIPANVLKAVAWQESGWNPHALSFDGQHGKGVMQIDDRFHEFARTPDVFDPAKNIDYGAKYLANLYKETGSWQGALKRYNGGDSYPPKVLALAEQQPWQRYT
jgi:hypothetical protein